MGKRPSLGYLIFGTLSYPNDANAEKAKTEIYKALSSGKKFNEVTAEFGSNDNEKKEWWCCNGISCFAGGSLCTTKNS